MILWVGSLGWAQQFGSAGPAVGITWLQFPGGWTEAGASTMALITSPGPWGAGCLSAHGLFSFRSQLHIPYMVERTF